MTSVRRFVSLVATLSLATSGLAATSLLAGTAPAQAATEEIYAAPASGSWTADGHGFGHGRGLAQWGAQAAALQGRTLDQILTFYYPGTTAASIGGPYVKVSLASYSPTTTVTIWSPENRPIRMGAINGETMHAAGRWTVTASGQQVTAQRRAVVNGPVLETVTITGVLRFESLSEYGMVIAPPETPTFSSQTASTGRWYRGDLRIEPQVAGFNVTNSLPMESYLKSVVPRESPASWQPTALQAQAVAARAYAWYKVTTGSALCDSTACQVYYGRGDATAAGNLSYSWEDSRTDAAIAATAGRVQNYGTSVAMTEFSSSNGGWTTASSLPYQVAKPDPWIGSAPDDTVTSWTSTLSVARVAQSCPGSVGTLRNLVVVARNGNGSFGGRVTQVRVECTTGNATVYSPSFGLRSNWWKPRDVTPRLESPAQSATAISYGAQMSLAATPNVGVTWTLTVRDHRTNRVVITTSGSAIAGQRFNATWFGRSAAGTSVGAGPYDLVLSAVSSTGASASPYRATVEVGPAQDPPVQPTLGLLPHAGYVPVSPARLVDTRDTFQSVGASQRVDILLAGQAGVPSSGVSAVVLNVTAVGATSGTHLRIWPAGAAMPTASALNTNANRTQASLVTVGLGGGGMVSLFNAAGSVHYLIDVIGYYSTTLSTSSRYTSVSPVRAFDSRHGVRLSGGSSTVIDVASKLGVLPGSIRAVVANLTAVDPLGDGYAVAYGFGGALPSTSSVNFAVGETVANRSVVPVTNGKITVMTTGSPTHLVVDLAGWYAPAGTTAGSLFTPVQPTRLLDTRAETPFGPGQIRSLKVTGGVIPDAAKVLVGTLTATGQTAETTHARLWPGFAPLTQTSDLNSGRGRTLANAVQVQLGADPSGHGWVQLYNASGQSHLILDAVGYFSP
ncbi:MAG: SpoIID/LytB domain-containing protein [Dermatophilaceae bacterium]